MGTDPWDETSTGGDDLDGDGWIRWEEFVVGTDSADATSAGFESMIEMGAAGPTIQWTPDLNGKGEKGLRVYTVLEADTPTGPWTEARGIRWMRRSGSTARPCRLKPSVLRRRRDLWFDRYPLSIREQTRFLRISSHFLVYCPHQSGEGSGIMRKISEKVRNTTECGEMRHSAYWYAKKYGIYHSDRTTYTGRYLDFIPVYHAFGDPIERRVGRGSFDPMTFAFYAAMDLGVLMAREMKRLMDPVERQARKEQIQTQLRRIQRPIYYAREKRRRQELAIERRKIHRRTTLAPMPTAKDIRAAWVARKESKTRMILLGGMLQDLECYVDRRLFFDDAGNIVRRAGGIRGWLRVNVPELAPHYKTLMRYKAMAIKLRQATGLHDPVPTSTLLEAKIPVKSTVNENSCRKEMGSVVDGGDFAVESESENSCRKEIWNVLERRGVVMKAVLDGRKNTFAAILSVLEDELSPERVLCVGMNAPMGSRGRR